MGLFTLHNFCVSLHFLKLELDSKSRFPIFQRVLVLTLSWLMNNPKSLNSILYSKYPFFNSRQPYHYVPLSQCLNHKTTLSPPPPFLILFQHAVPAYIHIKQQFSFSFHWNLYSSRKCICLLKICKILKFEIDFFT